MALAAFAASLPLYFAFDFSTPGFQFVDRYDWVPSWGISYGASLDGVSLWLVLLTTFLTPITLISTWDSVHKDFRGFQILMLLLETGMLGVFVAQDLFLFYIFWEFTLIPMALLIGIWGSSNRVHAAVKFFLYTFAGSVFMLLGIIALYLLNGAATGTYTFDFPTIQQNLAARHAGARRNHRPAAVRGVLPGLRDQGAAVAVPHLAARLPTPRRPRPARSFWPACC